MTRRKEIEQNPGSALSERPKNGRRKISLTKAERLAIKRAKKAQFAASLFLDINNDYTYAQIAEKVSEEFKEKFSIHALKDLVKTREFDEAYNGLLPEITTDPRYKAARSQAGDMLSRAMRELRNLIESPGTPANVKLKAIEKILDLNGITAPKDSEGDAAELSRFLASKGIELHQTNNILVVPAEYQEAMKLIASTQEEIVEGEIINSIIDNDATVT